MAFIKPFDLTIHDSMYINTIIEMAKEKNQLDNKEDYFIFYDGEYKANKNKKALFYNLRESEYIHVDKEILWG